MQGVYKRGSRGPRTKAPEGLGGMLTLRGSKAMLPSNPGDGLTLDRKRAKYLNSLPTSLFRAGANVDFSRAPVIQNEMLYETQENASLQHAPVFISNPRIRRISEMALSRVNYAPQLEKWMNGRSPLDINGNRNILVQGEPWKSSEHALGTDVPSFDDGGTYYNRTQLQLSGAASRGASRTAGLMKKRYNVNLRPQNQGYQLTTDDKTAIRGTKMQGFWDDGRTWAETFGDTVLNSENLMNLGILVTPTMLADMKNPGWAGRWLGYASSVAVPVVAVGQIAMSVGGYTAGAAVSGVSNVAGAAGRAVSNMGSVIMDGGVMEGGVSIVRKAGSAISEAEGALGEGLDQLGRSVVNNAANYGGQALSSVSTFILGGAGMGGMGGGGPAGDQGWAKKAALMALSVLMFGTVGSHFSSPSSSGKAEKAAEKRGRRIKMFASRLHHLNKRMRLGKKEGALGKDSTTALRDGTQMVRPLSASEFGYLVKDSPDEGIVDWLNKMHGSQFVWAPQSMKWVGPTGDPWILNDEAKFLSLAMDLDQTFDNLAIDVGPGQSVEDMMRAQDSLSRFQVAMTYGQQLTTQAAMQQERQMRASQSVFKTEITNPAVKNNPVPIYHPLAGPSRSEIPIPPAAGAAVVINPAARTVVTPQASEEIRTHDNVTDPTKSQAEIAEEVVAQTGVPKPASRARNYLFGLTESPFASITEIQMVIKESSGTCT